MLRPEYIYGNTGRLFLNTELGCTSGCTYCYLPFEGHGIALNRKERDTRINADVLLDALIQDNRVQIGQDGTIFSIGCYSEAWDPINRPETIKLIQGLLELGNPIQLATKRRVKISDLENITSSAMWQGQLSIYVSSATIARWKEFEPRTQDPMRRFLTFASCKTVGVSSFLYIKPFLPSITINDWKKYGAIMKRYGIGCVVGDRFESISAGPLAPISERLFVVRNDEATLLRSKLSSFGPIFVNSVDAVASLRS